MTLTQKISKELKETTNLLHNWHYVIDLTFTKLGYYIVKDYVRIFCHLKFGYNYVVVIGDTLATLYLDAYPLAQEWGYDVVIKATEDIRLITPLVSEFIEFADLHKLYFVTNKRGELLKY